MTTQETPRQPTPQTPQGLPPPNNPAVQALLGIEGNPVEVTRQQAQARLTAVMQSIGINMTQAQRNQAREMLDDMFANLDEQEIANTLASLDEATLRDIITSSIRTVALEDEQSRRRDFSTAFDAAVLRPIRDAKSLAMPTDAAGYTLLLEDIEAARPQIENDYFQYWLRNRPASAPQSFDLAAPMNFLLGWWPQWSKQAVRNGAKLGLQASYETMSDVVQGLINTGAQLGQQAKQNTDRMKTMLNRLRVGVAGRAELKDLGNAMGEISDEILTDYARIATLTSPEDFLNLEFPRRLQIALAGRPEAASIVQGDAAATIGQLANVFGQAAATASQQRTTTRQQVQTVQQARSAFPDDPETAAEAEAAVRNALAENPNADVAGIVRSFQQKAQQKVEAPQRQAQANQPTVDTLAQLGVDFSKLDPTLRANVINMGTTTLNLPALLQQVPGFVDKFPTPEAQAQAVQDAMKAQPGNPAADIATRLGYQLGLTPERLGYFEQLERTTGFSPLMNQAQIGARQTELARFPFDLGERLGIKSEDIRQALLKRGGYTPQSVFQEGEEQGVLDSLARQYDVSVLKDLLPEEERSILERIPQTFIGRRQFLSGITPDITQSIVQQREARRRPPSRPSVSI